MLSSGIVLHKAIIYGITGMFCLLIGITEERKDMKIRRCQASQLDPRALVVPIKDHERRIENIKGEVAIMLASLQEAGKITRELKEYLTNKINEL